MEMLLQAVAPRGLRFASSVPCEALPTRPLRLSPVGSYPPGNRTVPQGKGHLSMTTIICDVSKTSNAKD